MTWEEAKLTLQLMAEERIGTLVRDAQRRARAAEDEAWAALTGSARS